jgi:hypothetical protein
MMRSFYKSIVRKVYLLKTCIDIQLSCKMCLMLSILELFILALLSTNMQNLVLTQVQIGSQLLLLLDPKEEKRKVHMISRTQRWDLLCQHKSSKKNMDQHSSRVKSGKTRSACQTKFTVLVSMISHSSQSRKKLA